MTAPDSKPKRKLTGWRRWVVEGSIALAVFVAINLWQGAGLLTKDTQAPAFSLQSVSGETITLEQFAGKTVLLHFWATWCGACKREFGTLNGIYSEMDEDVVVLSLVADGDNPDLEQFVDQRDLQYPVLRASEELIESYRVGAFPTNYFVNPEGRIAHTSVGITSRWGMDVRLLLTQQTTAE